MLAVSERSGQSCTRSRVDCKKKTHVLSRSGLPDKNPDTWSPCAFGKYGLSRCPLGLVLNLGLTRVREDEETSRNDHDCTDRFVLFWVLGGTDTGEDEQPCRLPDTSNDQGLKQGASQHASACEIAGVDTNPSSAKPPHDPDSDERAAKVDSSQDNLRNERVLDSDRLEDCCAVAGRKKGVLIN